MSTGKVEVLEFIPAPKMRDYYLRFVAAFGIDAFDERDIEPNDWRGRQCVLSYVKREQGYGVIGHFVNGELACAGIYKRITYGPQNHVAWQPTDDFEIDKECPSPEMVGQYGDWFPRGLYAYGWWRDEILGMGLFSEAEGAELIAQAEANYVKLEAEYQELYQAGRFPESYREFAVRLGNQRLNSG